VFVDGKCIGGGSETVEMHKSGLLKEMLVKGDASDTYATEETTASGDPK